MIKKVNGFQVFSENENLVYKFTRDLFSNFPGPTPFVLRKVSRYGEVKQEVREIEEATAGFILQHLLLKKQNVEIEFFTYTREFQERLNK